MHINNKKKISLLWEISFGKSSCINSDTFLRRNDSLFFLKKEALRGESNNSYLNYNNNQNHYNNMNYNIILYYYNYVVHKIYDCNIINNIIYHYDDKVYNNTIHYYNYKST